MDLQIPGNIILSALAGSHAYGLNIATSDKDFRGVFVADKHLFYASNFPVEVSDASNDQSYFELGKFAHLLSKNNPTVLEFLAFPERCIREKHSLFALFKEEEFLTKQCQNSYVGYALGQIRKAYNLKKRISYPDDEQKKSFLNFCAVMKDGALTPFSDSGITVAGISVSELLNQKDIYALWRGDASDFLELNSDHYFLNKKEGEELLGYLVFDKQAYAKYTREYKSFFKWKEDRVKFGYSRGEGEYDGKFLMHTFRLLLTAKDIATKGEIILERPEKEYLLDIRNHKFEFGGLIKEAENLVEEVRHLFGKSDLPEEVDSQKVAAIVNEIREEFYSKK